jgi:exodeoxyribonuclease VII large subunit
VLGRAKDVDVIIVGRGGGSFEDLNCFNDELVARAIAGSKIPVVSAVGHETDFTIADFAADLRAPTPSAAAELCCPVYADIVYSLAEFEEDIRSAASDRLNECGAKLAALKSSSAMANPVHALELLRERLASKKAGIESAASAGLKNAAFLLKNRVDTLKALSPDSVLERGYSIVTDADGRMLKSASELRKNETIKVKMANGCASAVVTGVDMR